MAGLPVPAEVATGPAHGGDEHQRHRHDAGGGAEPEQQDEHGVVEHRVQRRGVRCSTRATASSAAITTTLLSAGAKAAAAKRRRAFSIAVASAVTP